MRILTAALFTTLLLHPHVAMAQADEIQVYDGGLAEPGIFNLTLHSNFTPRGVKTPAFPGAVVADQSFNGVPEWAYGVTDWFEAGCTCRCTRATRAPAGDWTASSCGRSSPFRMPTIAASLRRQFRVQLQRETLGRRRFTSEVRPIVGWHLKPWDIIINPIVDTSYDGSRTSSSCRRCASPTTSTPDGPCR